ncbi:MAG: hypothetical protein WBL05_02700 [Brooklawnia sp.]|uniref:hypothetical protein n=1 Tax=Brooklawnia sp. TaxID=2699740 RepID=UPI003C760556
MPDSQVSPHTTPARPDTRDWTFVISEPCPECGFTPQGRPETVGAWLRDAATRWQAVLARPGVTVRTGRVVAAGVRLPRGRTQPDLRKAG